MKTAKDTSNITKNVHSADVKNAQSAPVRNPPKIGAKTRNILHMIDSTLSSEPPPANIYRNMSVESIGKVFFYKAGE